MDVEARRSWAARIKPERERVRLSRAELAESAGISLRTLASMERGDHLPHEDKLLAVLRALGLAPERDPRTDEDTEAVLTLLDSIARRLPEDELDEWASHVTEEFATIIRRARPSRLGREDMEEILQRAQGRARLDERRNVV